MKQFYLTGIFVAAMLLTACNDEEKFVPTPHEGILKATVESNSPSTRAGFTDNNSVSAPFYWSEGDQIGVTTSESQKYFALLKLDASSIGQANGNFDGEIMGSLGDYAVYPYKAAGSMEGTTLTYKFPSTYNYEHVDADYQTTELGKGNSFNPAMWGKISNGTVGLKHLGGVLCIKINKLPTGNNMKLVVTSELKINGSFSVTLAENAEITTTSATGEDGKVTITFNNSTENTSGVFYLPVPVGNHTLFLKVLDESDNEKISTPLGTYNITRCLLKKLELNSQGINAGTQAEVKNATDVKEQLTKSDYVVLTSETTEENNNTIELPAITDNKTAKTVVLGSVSSNSTLQISDAANTGETSIENLSLFFTKKEETQPTADAPTLNLNTPNTTSTLQSTVNDFKFKEVTASTAENTLIVGKGIIIEKLIVAKGNVRVNTGATINALQNNTEGKVTIIKEEGANLPGSISSEDFIVISASAEQELQKAINNGGTVNLSSDVVISTPLVVEKNVVINLNGHTIKPKTGALTKILNTSDAMLLVRRGATLTINGEGSIDSEKNENILATIKLTDKADETGDYKTQAAHLIVNGGTIKSKYFAISGNGTRDNTKLEIKGGTISSLEGYALYSPQTGTTTISGGTISGAAGAIALQDGELNISGNAELISKGTAEYDETPGDGTRGLKNAVVCVPARYGACTVNISGGTFTAEGNSTTFHRQYLGKVGQFYNQSKIEISGGTFSNLDETGIDFRKYLVDNADVKVKFNKDCSISFGELKGKKSIAVDLNNHTLTMISAWSTDILNSASLSFSNGTIQFKKTDGVFWVRSGSKITINNVHISGSNYAFWVQEQDAELHIENSSVIEATISPLTTNANVKDNALEYGSGAKIYLSDSEFKGQTGFMNNVPATVEINNCKFSGNHQAALLRGGDYTIQNSTFTLNAELESSHTDNKGLGMWGQGNVVAFAGITIGNHITPESVYQYPTNVNMTKVEVTVSGTHASSFPAICACANSAADKGVTIIYDSQCSFTSSYSSIIEYGTTNITVNGKSVIDNSGKFEVEN